MQDNTKPKSNPFSSYGLRTCWSFCKPWRGNILLVLFVFAVSNVLITIQPLFIGKLVDAVSGDINANAAWMFAWILVATGVVHNWLWRAAEFLYRSLVFPISFHYESFLFKHVIQKPYPYFVDKFTGKIGSYITTTSKEIKWLLDEIMFDYIGSFVSIVSVILIMGSVNWQTAAIIVVCLVGMFFVGRYTLGKDMYYQKIEADINSTKNGRIIDSIANFVSVKSFHKERSERTTIDRQQMKTLKAGKQSFFWGIMFWGTQSIFVRDIMWPAIVILNLWMFLQGDITVGQFTTVLSTAILFTQSVWHIVWNVSQFGQRVSRIEEAHVYLFGEVNIANQPADAKHSHMIDSFSKGFRIRQLSFAYPDKSDVEVLQDINLDIAHGEKIGIVGRSGSGKSTLTKLLLDQYETPHGVFELDGQSVTARDLSRLVTYVPQDTSLFHRSIAENIEYAADSKVTREQIVSVAQKAEADEFIAELPEQYDTLVGERGVKLSGGQRQRIAIARAMLRDSPILVLDEATSALDSESEIHVQKALEALWQDKTVIAIAHRLSTLRNMDRIAVMERGRIIELGSHTELLAKNGAYAKLWQHQSGGFIEE